MPATETQKVLWELSAKPDALGYAAESISALRAQVEELEGELAEAKKFCGDAVMLVGKFTHMDPEDYMREGLDIDQMERALKDFLEGVEQQLEARSTRAEAALSEQSLNIVTMTHMHDTLRRSNEMLAERAGNAEAELAEERAFHGECPGGCGYWKEAARLREAERDEARAKCERLRERMIEIDRIASGNRVWAGVNGYKYGGLSDVRHKKIHAATQAALAECGEGA